MPLHYVGKWNKNGKKVTVDMAIAIVLEIAPAATSAHGNVLIGIQFAQQAVAEFLKAVPRYVLIWFRITVSTGNCKVLMMESSWLFNGYCPKYNRFVKMEKRFFSQTWYFIGNSD